MNVQCERSYLASAIAATGRAITGRGTIPILSNILVETEDDRLILVATDLDTSIRCVIPAEIRQNGSVAIPASAFNDIISKLPDVPVSLELADNRIRVQSGKSDYKMLFMPGEDYPVVPEVNEGVEITLPQAALKEMLRLTTFAANKEESASITMGVLFEARGNILSLVATNKHRMALKQFQLSQEVENPVAAVVPAQPLVELGRLLKESAEESITVRFGSTHVLFETSDTALFSRVLDGQYPSYEKIIPHSFERKITFDREEFLGALRRVHTVARSALMEGKTVIETKGDLLEMTAQSAAVGNAFEEVAIAMDGDGITIGFKSHYLMDVISALESEQVTLKLNGALNPGLITPVGDDSYRHIVMPLQV